MRHRKDYGVRHEGQISGQMVLWVPKPASFVRPEQFFGTAVPAWRSWKNKDAVISNSFQRQQQSLLEHGSTHNNTHFIIAEKVYAKHPESV